MIPKRNRVTKRLFDEVLKNGKVVHGDFVYFRMSPALDGVQRFSTVVPKKVFKKAHDRNKVKRQINALISESKTSFPNAHFIFFAKPTIRNVEKELIKKDIQTISTKLTK